MGGEENQDKDTPRSVSMSLPLGVNFTARLSFTLVIHLWRKNCLQIRTPSVPPM